MSDYIKKTEKKPNINKIYPKFLEDIARVLDFGDNKYGLMNWKNYKDINDLTSALFRHANQFNSGELLDKESGLSHLAHIASNCMMLMWLIDNNIVDIKDLYYNKENEDELKEDSDAIVVDKDVRLGGVSLSEWEREGWKIRVKEPEFND